MDKLQELLDAANCMAFAPNGLHRREMLAALESLQSALASGEVVVTTRDELRDRCGDRTGKLCLHADNQSIYCTAPEHCPRLPR